MFCLMVENWWKLHLLWRVLGCLLSHLLCLGFSGAACGQAQRRWEFNLFAFKGFWEVSAGVSCPGFGVWLRGGLWAAPVAGLICLWRVLMVRRSFAGWCIGRCPWYFFILVGNANLGALCSLCFSGCGVSLRVFVIFICVLV